MVHCCIGGGRAPSNSGVYSGGTPSRDGLRDGRPCWVWQRRRRCTTISTGSCSCEQNRYGGDGGSLSSDSTCNGRPQSGSGAPSIRGSRTFAVRASARGEKVSAGGTRARAVAPWVTDVAAHKGHLWRAGLLVCDVGMGGHAAGRLARPRQAHAWVLAVGASVCCLMDLKGAICTVPV